MKKCFRNFLKNNIYHVCLVPEVDAVFVSCSYLNISVDPDSLLLGGGAVKPPMAPASDLFSSSYLEMVKDLH